MDGNALSIFLPSRHLILSTACEVDIFITTDALSMALYLTESDQPMPASISVQQPAWNPRQVTRLHLTPMLLTFTGSGGTTRTQTQGWVSLKPGQGFAEWTLGKFYFLF